MKTSAQFDHRDFARVGGASIGVARPAGVSKKERRGRGHAGSKGGRACREAGAVVPGEIISSFLASCEEDREGGIEEGVVRARRGAGEGGWDVSAVEG
eukprot:764464-Hanusia_phi.AAC.2